MSQLAMAIPEPPEKPTKSAAARRRAEEKKERRRLKKRWYKRLRPAIRERYRGQEITTDEVWALIKERPELRVPKGLSPNAMGHIFSTWEHATPSEVTPFRHSARPSANRNLLRVWWIS